MIPRMKWFERRFVFTESPQLFPLTLERLRGTPVRLEERIRHLSSEQLTRRVDDSWSIQENAGHLLDLEPLWMGRIEDTLRGKNQLRDADLKNRSTHEANWNQRQLEEILTDFRQKRSSYVARLEGLSQEDLECSALHPRLLQPMRIMDAAFFAAEHDDHHLARITEILSAGGPPGK